MNKLLLLPALFLAGLVTVYVYFSPSSPRSSLISSQFVDVETPGGVLRVAQYETTVGQWRACNVSGACSLEIANDIDANLPVSGLNWADLKEYLHWYAKASGMSVRLPSRQEWLWIAADHAPDKTKKLFDDPRMAWAASYDMTRRVGDTTRNSIGSYGANQNDVFDMTGNVWEWTSTCEPDLVAIDGQTEPCFSGRIAMGKHAAVLSDQRRDPGNAGCSVGQPPDQVGFRIIIDP